MTTGTAEVTETATETAAEDTSSPQETAGQTESQAAPETPKAFDPNTIPEEIKNYFAEQNKKYADYDNVKQAASQFQQVQADPRYQEWVKSLNAPKKPEPFTISPEDHAAALGDPVKFQELVTRAAQHIAGQQFAPQIDNLTRENQLAKATAELNETIAKNPEFKELDKNGHILPVLQKYPGISFEDALAIAKKNTGWTAKEVAKNTAENVARQKAGITEKPGSVRSARGKKSFPDRESAMEFIMSEARAGRDVDEDDLEIA